MKKTTTMIAGLALAGFVATAGALEVGDPAPQFGAKDQNGETWHSKNVYGQKKVIIYFYPAAMTGGCTKQACGYRDNKETLSQLDAEVIAVSGDSPENLKIFEKAYDLNFTLLADEDGAIAKAFGVPTKKGGTITRKVDGKEVELARGVTASRWTFTIGKDGRITSKNQKVNAAGDSRDSLSVLKAKDK